MSAGPTDPAAKKPATRVAFVSLGCSKNLVDSEVMLGHLDRCGCSFVQDPSEAEVVVVNTCSFIGPAREESVQAILEAAELKKTHGVKRVVVAGCMVQRYASELKASLPEIDGFVGLDELERIVEKAGLGTPLPGALPIYPAAGAAPARSRWLYDDTTPRRRSTPPWTAFVKIAEGCDHTCSFCAIPSFRGTFRSRRPSSVLNEARALAASGVREVNLIAQDSSHFGRDLGLRDGLADLLCSLDEIEDLRWIRLHYLYPNTVTDALIETMARLPRVVKYVDMPLQHAHPDTLRRMRRGGSSESHLELLSRFRAAMPQAAVRTTLITGFPGETDAEFAHLLDFVAEARFDHLGVFPYSHEEGTPAEGDADDVPEALKQERRAALLSRQQAIVAERNARFVGRRVELLIEGAHEDTDDLLVGRMSTQALEVDGQVLVNDGAARPGEFVLAEITEVAGYDLVGRVVGAV